MYWIMVGSWVHGALPARSCPPAGVSPVRDALAASDHFILLASPEAARSYWVDKEVAYWLEHKGPDTLYLVVTGGEVAWDQAAGVSRDRRRDGGAAGRGRAAQR